MSDDDDNDDGTVVVTKTYVYDIYIYIPRTC